MPRKTKGLKRKGAGFSNTKRRVAESRSACYKTTPMGNPHIYDKGLMNAVDCQNFVHKFDIQAFPVKDISGRDVYDKYKIEANEFFKSPSFKSKVTSNLRDDGIDFFYDGKSFKNERAKWYKEIGSRILWYKFPNPEVNKRGCYVLKDKPLTIEEVRTNTNDRLNAMLSTLPCITDKTVNRWYRKGQKLYNPDYKPPPQPPQPPPLPATNKE